MALPPQFLDELRARTPLPAVIGRRVRLARSGRQWKGCCPFHGEKTPSFYVYDDHYHCFGCGAHGDAITFVMQSAGASFPEAVEQLATEAGMQVPTPSPEAAEAEKRRLDLAAVLDAAAASFQRRLLLPEGRAARDYLSHRGLTEDTIHRFGLGWSGEGRGAVAADLAREGVTTDQLVDAGLMRRDDETGRVYDLFFNRVMFPIRDRSGRTISFGGRIMGDGQPKYVNGPETALFSKRRTLYGLDLAREAVRRGGILLVVEGYMDVIALGQAGFEAAVAPLGTALTEEQLTELWRLSPAPVLCFDGDAAGKRAFARVADMALRKLGPDRTVKHVSLPAGHDPDSLLRRDGREAFLSRVAQAAPLSQATYDILAEAVDMRSPEARAKFRTQLEETARNIADRILASEFRQYFLERFFGSRITAKRDRAPNAMFATLREITPPLEKRLTYMLSLILRHPQILPSVESEFELLDLPPNLALLREEVWEWRSSAAALMSDDLMGHLRMRGLGEEGNRIFSTNFELLGAARKTVAEHDPDALAIWTHYSCLTSLDALAEQIDDARTRWTKNPTIDGQQKIVALATERLRMQMYDANDGL